MAGILLECRGDVLHGRSEVGGDGNLYFIGVGEGVDDLEPFKARDFARAIAGSLA